MKKLLPILILLCVASSARAGFVNISNLTAMPQTFATDNDTLNFTENVTKTGSGLTITGKNVVILGNDRTFIFGTDGTGGYAINFNNGASGGSDGRARMSRLTIQCGTPLASTTVSASPTCVVFNSGDYNRLDSCYIIAQGTNGRAVFFPYGSTTANVAMAAFFRTRFTTTSVRCTDRQSTSIAGLFTCNSDPRGVGNGGAHDPKMTQVAPFTNQHDLLLAGQPATQKVYHVWMYGCKIERACIQGANLKGYIRAERDTFYVDAANLINVAGNCYDMMLRGCASNPTCQSTDMFGVFYCIFGSGTTYAGGRNLWTGYCIGTPDHPFYIRGNSLTAVTKPSGNFAEGIQGSTAELQISHGLRFESEGSNNSTTGARRYAYFQVDQNIVAMRASQSVTDVIGLLANMRLEDTFTTIENNTFTISSLDGYGAALACFQFGYGSSAPPTGWTGTPDPTMIARNNTFNYGGGAVCVGSSAGQSQTPVNISSCTFRELPADSVAWRNSGLKAGSVYPSALLVGRSQGSGGFSDTGTVVVDGIYASEAQSNDIDFIGASEPSFDAGSNAVTCSILVVNASGVAVPNARVHLKNAQSSYVMGSATNYVLSNADGYAIQIVERYRKERANSANTTIDRNPFTVFAAENVTGGDTSVGATAVTLAYNKKRDTVVLPNTGTGAFYNGLTVVVDSIANDYSNQLDSIRIRVTTDSRAWPDSFTVSYGTAATYPAYNAATQHFVQAWTASTTFNLWITGFSMYESDTLLITDRVYDFDSLSPIAQTSRAFMEPPICTYSISADTIDFGTVDSGAVVDIAVQLTNSGGEQIVGTPVVAGSSKFTIHNGGGVYTLTETQSRTATLRFAPNVPNATDYATFTFGSGTCLKTYVLKGTATTVTPPPPTPNTSAFKIRIKKT